MRTLDSGTMGGDAGCVGFLLAMLAVTLGGIFVISTLIGVLTTGIDEQARRAAQGPLAGARDRPHGDPRLVAAGLHDHLRAGQAPTRTSKSPSVVILGDHDKVEMEDEIRATSATPARPASICRTGSPIDLDDLEIVSLHDVALDHRPVDRQDDPDTDVIKTLLAITNNPRRRARAVPHRRRDPEPPNLDVGAAGRRRRGRAGRAGDLLSRIIVQTCRQSGLSVVYTELLDFGGDEIYFAEGAELAGKTFGEALLAYEDSAVIGMRTAGGRRVNPPMDTVIRPGPGDRGLRRRRRRYRREARRRGSRRSRRSSSPAARQRRPRTHADPRLERARADHHRRTRPATSRRSSVNVVADRCRRRERLDRA